MYHFLLNGLTDLESGLGLDIVIWVQSHRNPVLDAMAVVLHYIGQDAVYLIIGLLLYAWVDRRKAGQWFYLLIVTSIFTNLLKAIIIAPRPYQIAPELVRIIVPQGGYGLPSGHVSHAVAMLTLIALWYPRWWTWLLVAIGSLAMAWARMYLGVHYPQDVIAGALLGVGCLWLCLRTYDFATRQWMRLPIRLQQVLLIVLVILAIAGVISSILGY